LAEVRETEGPREPFDFELIVMQIALDGPAGMRARYWQDPATAKWEVHASDPDNAAGPSVTFQLDDSQKHAFPLGQRIKVTIEPT